ncbi:hypothetical protein IscW_ISCW012809 [Ixodes scapularis]|uniref:Uncharacterized protein n=1 Tax=Ixodes scapularis TaxID=6945 RepID=B7QC93_IXOSC|nr:hypothetical protein IscW_ISCW012809 [Ixodes scapularis]|eukprot:XP_002413157.1 hypothetical protein IscW_ISCW012809 [Ixodes scapularis]
MTIVMVTCESGLELTLTNLKSILAFSRASFRLIIYADARNINDLQVRDMLPKEEAVLYLDADILLLRPAKTLEVMPMNLTRMRNFAWGSRMEPLLEQYGSRLKWADQDIVNVIFNENPDKLFLMP